MRRHMVRVVPPQPLVSAPQPSAPQPSDQPLMPAPQSYVPPQKPTSYKQVTNCVPLRLFTTYEVAENIPNWPSNTLYLSFELIMCAIFRSVLLFRLTSFTIIMEKQRVMLLVITHTNPQNMWNPPARHFLQMRNVLLIITLIRPWYFCWYSQQD